MSEPMLPEAVLPGRNYSLWAEMKLNAWAFVAVATSFAGHMVLPRNPDWPVLSRAALALLPLLPTLLYVRRLSHWLRGRDEQQRRIQLEAVLFAALGALFVTAALSMLSGYDIRLPRLGNGLGWEGTFALVLGSYFVANFILNRRYR